jgi:hypothetical protein
VWRSPVPRHPWIFAPQIPCTPEAVPEFSRTISETIFSELMESAGTSSRCDHSSDADPEVSPSLDAPATICHPFGVRQQPVQDLFHNRNLNLNRNLPFFIPKGEAEIKITITITITITIKGRR